MSQYIFSEHDDDRELERLRLIEQVVDPATIGHLEQTGVGPGWQCLEVGAGAGSILRWLGEAVGAGGHVVGVDRNRGKIDKARRLFPETSFTRADILELPVAQRYDTVILAEVLEHVPEEIGKRMLDRAWELVAPRGRLIVSVPNEDCVRHANHVQEFTRHDLVAPYDGAGWQRLRFLPPTPPNRWCRSMCAERPIPKGPSMKQPSVSWTACRVMPCRARSLESVHDRRQAAGAGVAERGPGAGERAQEAQARRRVAQRGQAFDAAARVEARGA